MTADPTTNGAPVPRGAVPRARSASQGSDGPGRPRRGPVDPRLVRRARATGPFLAALVVAGVAGALLTLAQAWLLSRGLGGVFETRDAAPLAGIVAPLVAVFAGKAALAWLNQWLAHRAAAAVKSQLRVDIVRARLDRPLDAEASTGGLVTLVTQGLDALDGFYSKYLPQLVLAVVVPVIVGVAILTTDWISTLIVALTLPLIPIFMALVGWTTEARTKKRWALQTRLARHFADLVDGLPTLQVFGRARAQAEGLRRTEGAHRAETMQTLRISFLSALVLELLSTLSVAIVAVTIGFRVLFGDIGLTDALFVLILAPEVYLPVRQVGVHYHDSADGMAAAQAAFAQIDGPAADGSGGLDTPLVPRGYSTNEEDAVPGGYSTNEEDAVPGGYSTNEEDAVRGSSRERSDRVETPPANGEPDLRGSSRERSDRVETPLLAVRGLGHTYPGAAAPAVSGVSFAVPRGRIVALTGPSGGGKSTVLNALIGFVRPSAGSVEVDGRPLAPDALAAWRRRVAYVGQNPGMIAGDIAGNVRLGFPGATDADVRAALDAAGAPELAPDHPVGDDGQGLSAGERRRVATARALLRIRLGGAEALLLDEPTAGLDADAEAVLLRGLRGSGVAAVVVSHRPAVIAEADQVIEIGAAAAGEASR